MNAKGWHTRRIASVKLRFDAAAKLIHSGYDVLMHDADAFLSLSSVSNFMRYVSIVLERQPGTRLIVQDNGRRRVTYDRVNWGFAWIRNSSYNADIFRCTLDRWDDRTFGCSDNDCDHSYHSRSQPRINHILEETISNGMELNLCLITNDDLRHFGVHHMTGYTSASMKTVCAKARGALIEETHRHATISYSVPYDAPPAHQKRALLAALMFAEQLSRKLELPEAYFDGKKVDICLLFDLQDPSVHNLLTASTSDCRGQVIHSTPDLRVNAFKVNAQHICMDFHDLSNVTATWRRLHLCRPDNPFYAGLHMCQRDNSQSDEI